MTDDLIWMFITTNGEANKNINDSTYLNVSIVSETERWLAEAFRKHWQALHSQRNPTREWFNEWIATLPGCSSCQSWFLDYMQTNPPRFDDWPVWCWEAHNAANLKLDKPLLGYLDAMSEQERGSNADDGYVQLLQPMILHPIPKPTSNRAIITVAPDRKSQAELAITGDRMRAYAQRNGCDFLAITRISKQRYLPANKYAYAEVAAQYEQSLWLDTDVVVDPMAPSIFDEVPLGSWGMVDDLVFMEETKWFHEEWRRMQMAWGVPLTPIPKAWNSGVVVAPQDAARCYYPSPMRVPNVWCAEQHWHTQCLIANSASIVDLATEWNNGYPWRAWPSQLATSWFNHVNGCRPQSLRLALLAHLAAGNTTIPASLTPTGGDAWQPPWAENVSAETLSTT